MSSRSRVVRDFKQVNDEVIFRRAAVGLAIGPFEAQEGSPPATSL